MTRLLAWSGRIVRAWALSWLFLAWTVFVFSAGAAAMLVAGVGGIEHATGLNLHRELIRHISSAFVPDLIGRLAPWSVLLISSV
jgi:hypothetical protein